MEDVAPARSEESDGGEEQHDIFIRSPAWIKRFNEALVLLIQVDAKFRGLFQDVHAQLPGSVLARQL